MQKQGRERIEIGKEKNIEKIQKKQRGGIAKKERILEREESN